VHIEYFDRNAEHPDDTTDVGTHTESEVSTVPLKKQDPCRHTISNLIPPVVREAILVQSKSEEGKYRVKK
jgi:hypothetical protein